MAENGSESKSVSNHSVLSAFSSKEPRKAPTSKSVPFNTCLSTLLTVCGCFQLSAIVPGVGSYFSIFMTFFIFEWFNIHFSAMTRTRRACFDVANVLETYQPRARTHGHLFVADPPTPCVKIAEDDNSHDMPKEKNAFSNARDSHYENMYQKAIQMAKEMEQGEKNGASPSLDCAQENVELKQADPAQDKKDGEEKAKKAKEKYDADMSKPFSC